MRGEVRQGVALRRDIDASQHQPRDADEPGQRPGRDNNVKLTFRKQLKFTTKGLPQCKKSLENTTTAVGDPALQQSTKVGGSGQATACIGQAGIPCTARTRTIPGDGVQRQAEGRQADAHPAFAERPVPADDGPDGHPGPEQEHAQRPIPPGSTRGDDHRLPDHGRQRKSRATKYQAYVSAKCKRASAR